MSEANNFRFQNIDKLKTRPSLTPAQFSTSELLFKMSQKFIGLTMGMPYLCSSEEHKYGGRK